MDQSIKTDLLEEVKEVIFNEEFRAILRRNLYSMDGGDIGSRMATDLIQSLQESTISKSVQGGVLRAAS